MGRERRTTPRRRTRCRSEGGGGGGAGCVCVQRGTGSTTTENLSLENFSPDENLTLKPTNTRCPAEIEEPILGENRRFLSVVGGFVYFGLLVLCVSCHLWGE